MHRRTTTKVGKEKLNEMGADALVEGDGLVGRIGRDGGGGGEVGAMDLFEEPAEEKGERAGGEEDHVEELAEA